MKQSISRGLGVALVLLLVVPAFAQEAKDPNPPVAGPGGEAPATTGGPDAFGYTFADSAEATCPTVGFYDISATGVSIASGDDVSGTANLGAAFDFYGTSFTQLQAASNGYISTDTSDTGPDLSNDCPLPVTPSTGGGARMYPLHDDLIVGNLYYEYFDVCPIASPRCAGGEACSIFQWDNTTHFGGGGPWDMQAVLFHTTNDFIYLIGPGNPELGSGSTTGIQDFPTPTTGLTYACNTAASIPDNTQVCFFHPNALPAACLPYVPPVIQEIPTLGVAGLVGLALLLGATAFLLMRRRTA